MNTADWITSITSILTASAASISAMAVFLLWRQLAMAREQIETGNQQLKFAGEQLRLQREAANLDFERSRKEKAIELMAKWSDFVGYQGTAAKNFAERLDIDECTALWNEREFSVESKYKSYLEKTLPELGELMEDEARIRILITESQSSFLRKQVATYLNHLETILSAYFNGVADQEMIKAQFKNLVSSTKNKTILSTIREVAGGFNAFPSIEYFVREIIEDERTLKDGNRILKLEQIPN